MESKNNSDNDIYCNKNYSRDDVEKILSEMREILTEQLSDPNANKVMLNPNHKLNKLFLRVSGISEGSLADIKRAIIGLFKDLEVTNFCHSEQDSSFPQEDLFCFKKEVQFADKVSASYQKMLDDNNVASASEVLLKFKFKRCNDDSIVFTMTYHFPTRGKKAWEYLFRESY